MELYLDGLIKKNEFEKKWKEIEEVVVKIINELFFINKVEIV